MNKNEILSNAMNALNQGASVKAVRNYLTENGLVVAEQIHFQRSENFFENGKYMTRQWSPKTLSIEYWSDLDRNQYQYSGKVDREMLTALLMGQDIEVHVPETVF